MAEIRPFAALHYNLDTFGRDLSSVIAPPYDVLSQQQLDRFQAASPSNIVHVDLPHFPPGSAGPDAAYQAADRTLKGWTRSRVLVQDPSPRFYAYRQDFLHGGKRYSRLCLFAVLRISEFGTGQVFPHEQTFGGPIADRLKLMQATSCQLSPIFGLVQAPLHQMVAKAMADAAAGWQGDLDGVHHEVTPVSDLKAIADLSAALAPLPVYIADGHHRYKTAMAYRDWLAGQKGSLPADHPANFVMLGLMAMQDPGNLVLPTHRIVEGLTPARLTRLREASKEMLQWRDLGKVSAEQAEKQTDRRQGTGLRLRDRRPGPGMAGNLDRRRNAAAVRPRPHAGLPQTGPVVPAQVAVRVGAQSGRRRTGQDPVHPRHSRGMRCGGQGRFGDPGAGLHHGRTDGRVQRGGHHAAKEHLFLPEARHGAGRSQPGVRDHRTAGPRESRDNRK